MLVQKRLHLYSRVPRIKMLSIQSNSLLLCFLIAVIIGSAYSEGSSCYICTPSDENCADPKNERAATHICGDDTHEPCTEGNANCFRLKKIHNISKQRSNNSTEDLCYSIYIKSDKTVDTGIYRGCFSSSNDVCDLLKEEFKETGTVVNCLTCNGTLDCNTVLEKELRDGNTSSLFRSSIGIVLLGAFLFSL